MSNKNIHIGLVLAAALIFGSCGDEVLDPVLDDTSNEVNLTSSSQKICVETTDDECIEVNANQLKAVFAAKSGLRGPGGDPGDDDVGTKP